MTDATDLAEPARSSHGWRWLTAEQTAELLGLSRGTLYAWISRGEKGPPFYHVGDAIRYRSDDVLIWLESQRQPGDGTVEPRKLRDLNGQYIGRDRRK